MKDAIRLKKGATICFPKGGIRGDHELLLTTGLPGKTHLSRSFLKIKKSFKLRKCELSYNLIKDHGLDVLKINLLVSRRQRYIPRNLHIIHGLNVFYPLDGRVEMDSIYTNMINAIEYRNVKAMVPI